ncbi:hypothetical protein H0H93_011019 [Arthromyces matolae]|nr:hypothetical protein H0H93_011019 [Arthromyces matolae]
MEDVDGVALHHEWFQPETRGEPVATLLTTVASNMQKMMSSEFSRIGSPYLLEDLPDSANLAPATDFEIKNRVRIGPIANALWWRCYHDEPHLDRGPWNTIEDYVKAAVRLERRAVELHRQDPSSLAYTKSSIEDLDEVEYLLGKVEELAPHIQHVIEHVSPMPERLMQLCFMHPDLRTHNIMLPVLTADNGLSRMLNPVLIDWQGACALPLALQWHTPPFVEYQAGLLDLKTGRPILEIEAPLDEVALPKDFDQLHPEHQDIIRAEHRIATRHVRWNQRFNEHPEFAPLISFRMQPNLHLFTQYILRACADGPFLLKKMLWYIELEWNFEEEKLGPCPFTLDFNYFHLRKLQEPHDRYENATSELMERLKCTVDGYVAHKDYEASMKEMEAARAEWDEKSTGGPFPFDDGRWGQFLR